MKWPRSKDDLFLPIVYPGEIILGFKTLKFAWERVCIHFYVDALLWRVSRQGDGISTHNKPEMLLKAAANGVNKKFQE